MIPIHLKIKGLYSYREQVEIDFEKLSEQHLFGIFGAVGSGKSAILEAITYALYGKTERLNLSGDNRNYNMLNLQSPELLIELEFKTLVRGNAERYCFRVKQSRNSKRFDDVRTATRTALHWKNNAWEPLPSTDATEILNLSYDNFIKTIIIPQGKFQDFLHMGPTERTRMLREIFSLDRFELSLQTGMLTKETNAQLDILQGQLMTLEESSAEMIAEKQAQSAEAEAGLAQAKEREQLLQQVAAKHRQLKELGARVAAAQQALQALEGQKAPMAERRTRLAQYQRVRLDFSELLSETQRLERAWKLATDAFAQAQDSVTRLEPQLAKAQQEAALAQADYAQRPQIEAQMRDCGHWIAIRQADAELAKLEERLKNGLAMTEKAETDGAAHQTAISTAEALLLTEKANLPDLAMIGEVKIWFQQKGQLEQQIGQLAAQIGSAGELAKSLLADLHALAPQGAEKPESAGATIAFLQENIAQVKARMVEVREKRELLARQGGLETHAASLKPGEPCPLCGSEHHPAPYDSGQSAITIADLAGQLLALEQQLAGHEKALQSAQAIGIRLEENAKQRSQLQASLAVQQQHVQAHLQQFRWPLYAINAPEKVEADGRAAAEAQARIAKAEQELGQMRKTAADLQAQQKKFEEGLARLRETQNQFLGQREAHRQQLTVLLGPPHDAMAEPALTALSQQLQSRHAALQTALEATQKAEKALEIQVAEARQRRSANEADQNRLALELQAAQQKLRAQLAASEFADEAALQAILAWQLDTVAEQAALDRYKDSLSQAETTLQLLATQTQGQTYDAAAHETAEAAWVAARGQIEDLQQAISLLRDAIARLQAALVQQEALKARQAQLQKRQANLKVLENLFKASGFVKYVSTIYLEELVRRADARFSKLTRNAMRLELGEDNDFLVRDMLNGGQTRSVKTLSGGQTFQASLCLALALADHVQQHSGSSHNFFFLDEGFGTLDKDSLSAVFDALKQLRQENRIVGVISHVDDMQQEIEVFLKVWQTEERGSLVKGSWE